MKREESSQPQPIRPSPMMTETREPGRGLNAAMNWLFHHASGRITHDPVTGDELTAGEAAAWRVQWIIRRWTFLVIVTAATAIAWTVVAATGSTAVLNWWNVGASYMALLIESVVGMAMYHQTQRDAQVVREVRTLTREIHGSAQRDAQVVREIHGFSRRLESLSEEIYDLQLRSERP